MTLVVFQELMKVPRLADCQQKLPAPSKVKGAVMVAVTGLQAPAPLVGMTVGVFVRVAVRLAVKVGPTSVIVPVGLGELVRVGVRVGEAPNVFVGVNVGPISV